MVEIVARCPEELLYDLPDDLIGKVWKGKWRGQRQTWFLMRFLGEDADVNIAHAGARIPRLEMGGARRAAGADRAVQARLYRDMLEAFAALSCSPARWRSAPAPPALERVAMAGLSSIEAAAVAARARGAPMLDQVDGLGRGQQRLAQPRRAAQTSPALLADAFAALPGELALRDAAPVEAMAADGRLDAIAHGRNLHLDGPPRGAGAAAAHRPYGHGVRAPITHFQKRVLARAKACSAAPASPT